jgi:hypothetical protein
MVKRKHDSVMTTTFHRVVTSVCNYGLLNYCQLNDYIKERHIRYMGVR